MAAKKTRVPTKPEKLNWSEIAVIIAALDIMIEPGARGSGVWNARRARRKLRAQLAFEEAETLREFHRAEAAR